MSDERFDYARKELDRAAERVAVDLAWLIARETGKHIGCDRPAEIQREKLVLAIESFLRA
jgi:hypothetical protein